MSIFEYDKETEEKKLREAEFEAGFEAGIEAGHTELLKQQIQKKLAKGKSPSTIAEELEESVSVIQAIVNKYAL